MLQCQKIGPGAPVIDVNGTETVYGVIKMGVIATYKVCWWDGGGGASDVVGSYLTNVGDLVRCGLLLSNSPRISGMSR